MYHKKPIRFPSPMRARQRGEQNYLTRARRCSLPYRHGISEKCGHGQDAVRYAVTGTRTDTEDGLYTASQNWGAEGTITVSSAGSSSPFVAHRAVFDDIGAIGRGALIETVWERCGNGTSATSYSPTPNETRGLPAPVHRLPASRPLPAEEGGPPSTNVPEGAYYAAANAWAQRRALRRARATAASSRRPRSRASRRSPSSLPGAAHPRVAFPAKRRSGALLRSLGALLLGGGACRLAVNMGLVVFRTAN
jgi:hypothetical protein